MRSLVNIIWIPILITTLSWTGTYAQTLHGTIRDYNSGEMLIGAHILILPANKGTQTDEFGRFHIRVSEFPVFIISSYVGYQSDTTKITEVPAEGFELFLHPSKLKEIVVTEGKYGNGERIGLLHIPVKQLTKNKFFLGEEDIIRSLSSLPGVSQGNSARNGLYVRGSDPEHNLFLLDGTPVYNTGHLFGMFSIFNSSTVKDVKLYKGDLPARYGSRLASVIDVNTREGNRKNYSSEYKIGLLSASGLWEGPVGDRASFIGAARTAYLGLALLPMWIQYEAGNRDNSINYWMYDLNLKGNWHPTGKDHLFVSVYHGNDGMPIRNKENNYESKQYLRWGNTTTSLRYSRTWHPTLYSRFQLYQARYNNIVKFTGTQLFDNGTRTTHRRLRDRSSVGELGFTNQNDWLVSGTLKFHLGVQLQRYLIRPNQITFLINELERGKSISNRSDIRPFWQHSYFVEGVYEPLNWLDLGMGMRASGYLLGSNMNKWFFEPRMNISVSVTPNHIMKASYSETSQFLHQLTHYTFGAPSDFWVPATGDVQPQTAHQWSVGYSTSLSSGAYDFSVEIYRKFMEHLINFQEGTEFLLLLDKDWSALVEHDGIGKARGLEWYFRKKEGRLTGWLGYTLSWSQRKFENLNNNRWFYSTYDRRHDVEIFLNYLIKEDWELSGSWQYQTGHRFTVPVAGTYRSLYYTEKNNWILPAFHQMNLGVTRSVRKSESKTSEFSFGIYNIYGRNNPLYIENTNEQHWEKDGQGKSKITRVRNAMDMISVFKFLPYFSYKRKLQ